MKPSPARETLRSDDDPSQHRGVKRETRPCEPTEGETFAKQGPWVPGYEIARRVGDYDWFVQMRPDFVYFESLLTSNGGGWPFEAGSASGQERGLQCLFKVSMLRSHVVGESTQTPRTRGTMAARPEMTRSEWGMSEL